MFTIGLPTFYDEMKLQLLWWKPELNPKMHKVLGIPMPKRVRFTDLETQDPASLSEAKLLLSCLKRIQREAQEKEDGASAVSGAAEAGPAKKAKTAAEVTEAVEKPVKTDQEEEMVEVRQPVLKTDDYHVDDGVSGGAAAGESAEIMVTQTTVDVETGVVTRLQYPKSKDGRKVKKTYTIHVQDVDEGTTELVQVIEYTDGTTERNSLGQA